MLHAIAQISAERMVNCLAQGILIALFAWIVLRVVGRRNSGTRFAVWFCALVAIAASPFLRFSVTGSSTPAASSAALTMPRDWALYLFAVWAGFAMAGLARVGAGLWHLWRIRRSCRSVAISELDPMLQSTLADFRSVRQVEICICDELRVPTAIGFFKPAVVFPAWALKELSAEELNTILLHELAHLRRWDDWTNLLQKVLGALFFFHPAVWWVERRLSLEREMACDDMVLAQTANPRGYAKCLVSLAERNLLLRSGMALAQAAVGRMWQTTQRVLQILDTHRPSGVRVWKPAPWMVGVFSAVCLVSASHAPKLVAFGDAVRTNESYSAAVSGRSIDASELPGARIVSAKYVAPDVKPSMQPLHSHRAAKKVASPAQPALLKTTEPVPAKSAHDAVRIVQTSTSVDNENAVPQPAVFVVVEGQQYGNAVVWQVSVWRIMVLERDPRVMNSYATQQSVSNSI
jgi:beta-lactamase regulating signal transducer with metallopeptidase domain